jgi:hypothetical protein
MRSSRRSGSRPCFSAVIKSSSTATCAATPARRRCSGPAYAPSRAQTLASSLVRRSTRKLISPPLPATASDGGRRCRSRCRRSWCSCIRAHPSRARCPTGTVWSRCGGRSSDSRRISLRHLLGAASQVQHPVPLTPVVPTYRCGAVPDSHRVPSCDDQPGDRSNHCVGHCTDGSAALAEKDTKTHQQRRITLDDETVEALRTHLAQLDEAAASLGMKPDPDASVFSYSPTGDKAASPSPPTNTSGSRASLVCHRIAAKWPSFNHPAGAPSEPDATTMTTRGRSGCQRRIASQARPRRVRAQPRSGPTGPNRRPGDGQPLQRRLTRACQRCGPHHRACGCLSWSGLRSALRG